MDLSILIISYNTRELTLACLRSVFNETKGLTFEVLVVENASSDGSAEAIAREFPMARMMVMSRNTGFAAANNLAAMQARGEFLLLLNPDTVVLDGAPKKLLDFAKQNPAAGIWGGRTLFGDGSLNPTSCWARPTLWSTFCRAVGLSSLFRGSCLFDPEAMSWWHRDTAREVDIVTGCLFLMKAALWKRLGGFDPAFFMYCEEVDLCLRAQGIGCRPMVTPTATIIHYGGASEKGRADKFTRQFYGTRKLFERHWGAISARIGVALLVLWVVMRIAAWRCICVYRGRKPQDSLSVWSEVWRRRGEWLLRETESIHTLVPDSLSLARVSEHSSWTEL